MGIMPNKYYASAFFTAELECVVSSTFTRQYPVQNWSQNINIGAPGVRSGNT
jgi:hypothetical protein